MQGWPISAWRDTYSGGGYVVNLKGKNMVLNISIFYKLKIFKNPKTF